MTYMGGQCMRDDPQVLSRRLAAFVRNLSAKELSGRVGCDVRTAENMRRGHWPIARHWVGLMEAFGDDVIEAVFYPARAKARLEREVKALEEVLALKRVALGDAQGPLAGDAQARPANEDRAARVDRREDAR